MNSMIQSEVHTECNHHSLLLGKFRIDNPVRNTSFYIPSFPRIFSKLYKKKHWMVPGKYGFGQYVFLYCF